MKKILIIFVLITKSRATAFNIKQCVAPIVEKYHTGKSCYAYEEDYFISPNFLSNNWTYYLIKQDYTYRGPLNNQLCNMIVLSLEDYGKLKSFLHSSILKTVDSLNYKFILLYFGDEELLEEVFSLFITYKLWDAIVITQGFKVFTHYPFSKRTCSDPSPIYLGKCVKEFIIQSDVLNFKNCPIRFEAHVMPPFVNKDNINQNTGLVISIVKIILSKLNVTYEFYLRNLFDEVPKLLDVLLLGSWSSAENSVILTYYLQNEITLFVPLAEARHPWLNIAFIYDLWTWCGIFISFALVGITWCKLNRMGLGNTLLFVLGLTIASLPKLPHRFQISFTAWCAAAIVLVNAFNGLLVSFMFQSPQDAQVSSLSDIARLDWKLLCFFMQKNVYNDIGRHINMRKHYIRCDRSEEQCYNLFLGGKYGYITSTRSFAHFSPRSSPRSHYKFMEWKTYLCMSFKPRSPYRAPFEKYLLQIAEHGLPQHLDKVVWDPQKYKSLPIQKITVAHLYLAFIIYVLGLFASSITLLLEFYFSHLSFN